jgi:hypothetical protein
VKPKAVRSLHNQVIHELVHWPCVRYLPMHPVGFCLARTANGRRCATAQSPAFVR